MLFAHLKLGFPIPNQDFDRIYPKYIQQLSKEYWTPIDVCIKAAKLLAQNTNTKILDIGSGVGKFCLIGSTVTGAKFTGVEQRKDFVDLTRKTIQYYNISNVEIIHSNIKQINFRDYNAFYLFNPFYEHLINISKIDSSISTSPDLYYGYTKYVKNQLELMPLGTRIVTFHSHYDAIPLCYEIIKTGFGGKLKLWEKKKVKDSIIYLQEKLIIHAVFRLKKLGFTNVNDQNITRDETYKIYFERILKSKLGQTQAIDEAVNELLKKLIH